MVEKVKQSGEFDARKQDVELFNKVNLLNLLILWLKQNSILLKE
jgi:hypothetical protein